MARRLSSVIWRLHIEYDSKELSTAAVLQEPHYNKFNDKDGRECQTSAFQVSGSILSRGKFYDEAIWPEGYELRK